MTSERCLRVAVGSKNPSKIKSVEKAVFRALHRDGNRPNADKITIKIQGFSVPSSVSDQPFGDDETCTGARNRARGAYEAFFESNKEYPHLSVGPEGGLEWLSRPGSERREKDLYCMAWMAIYGKRDATSFHALASTSCPEMTEIDTKPTFGVAKTANFLLPKEVCDLVKSGSELGDAIDQVFKKENSKHGLGAVGILTEGLIDRAEYYEHTLILALIHWIRPDLYPDGN